MIGLILGKIKLKGNNNMNQDEQDNDSLEMDDPVIQGDKPIKVRQPPDDNLKKKNPENTRLRNNEEKTLNSSSSDSSRYLSMINSKKINYILIIAVILLSFYIILNEQTFQNFGSNSKTTQGKISLDNNNYSIGDIATITLGDPDMNINVNKVDTVWIGVIDINTEEKITLELQENGKDTGIFTQKFTLAKVTDEKQHNIKVTINDTIIILYLDEKKDTIYPEFLYTKLKIIN